jgi:hypothetical protein
MVAFALNQSCRVMAKRLRDVCGLPESEPLWKTGRGFVVRDLPWTVEKLRVIWRSGVSAERRHLKISGNICGGLPTRRYAATRRVSWFLSLLFLGRFFAQSAGSFLFARRR